MPPKYDITTATQQYYAPSDGVSGKSTFQGLVSFVSKQSTAEATRSSELTPVAGRRSLQDCHNLVGPNRPFPFGTAVPYLGTAALDTTSQVPARVSLQKDGQSIFPTRL